MLVLLSLLAVAGWTDIFGYVKEMFSALLYLLPSVDCKTLNITKSCKFSPLWLHLRNILIFCKNSCWVLLNFRNITFLNPRRHDHIPKPPDGVVIPKKVCIQTVCSYCSSSGWSYIIVVYLFTHRPTFLCQ